VDSSPAMVARGAVYVGSKDGKVYAFGTPLTVSISPASVVMDVGQSQQFNSIVSGGASPYTYKWYSNGTAISGATSSNCTFTPIEISVTRARKQARRKRQNSYYLPSFFPTRSL
jgi:hypothetical protein